ncbi:MAG: metallophosphoesterase [bacterium]|nr:metallophosphoesterase [bacterium]
MPKHKKAGKKKKNARKSRKKVRASSMRKLSRRSVKSSVALKPETLKPAIVDSADAQKQDPLPIVTEPKVSGPSHVTAQEHSTAAQTSTASPNAAHGTAADTQKAAIAEKDTPPIEKPAVSKPNIEKGIVVSNIRVPHQDEKALALVIMHAKDLGVDRVFFNGDIWDYFHRSHISRDPLRVFSERERKTIGKEIEARVREEEQAAQEELNEKFGVAEETGEPKRLVKSMSESQLVRAVKREMMERALRKEMEQLFGIFRMFREALPNAEFIWIYGCDEHYLVAYLTKYYPELLEEMAKFCKAERIEQRYNGTRNNTYRYGLLEIGHWFRGGLSSPSGYVAHTLLDDEGVSLIQGHTNRGGWACRTIQGPKYLSAYENFSLCRRPIGKNWQLGYSVVYHQRGRQRFQVYQVPIADYGFFWGTKEYASDPSKVSAWEIAVAISDIHIPYEDENALSASFELIAELQPAVIFVNGDANDFADISRFAKSAHDELTEEEAKNPKALVIDDGDGKRFKTRLERELEKIYNLFKRLRKIAPNARIVWIFGNHEYRLQRYVEENAAQLAGVRRPGEGEDVLSLASLSKVKELGIEIVYSKLIESYTTYGGLLVGHFYLVRQKSAHSARALLQKKHKSLIQPHVHRVGAHYQTRLDGKMYVAVETGCLCDLNPKYMQDPNWQHGFVVIHKKKTTDRFYLQPIHIVDGAFLFGGKRYGRKSKEVLDPNAVVSNGNGLVVAGDPTPDAGPGKDSGKEKSGS